MTEKMRMAEQALEQGKGILRLAPTWVPRSFCRPGKRIKLHPDDYFILGQRGGIDERWFSSTTWAENGPDTPEDEGLQHSKKILHTLDNRTMIEARGDYYVT